MKLEARLGISSGILVLAMFVSSFAAYLRIQEANRLSVSVVEQHIPVSMAARDLLDKVSKTLHAQQSAMLFGITPSAALPFRMQRKEYWQQAEDAMARLRALNAEYDLGPDRQRIFSIGDSMASVGSMEERVDTLGSSQSNEGTAQAYELMRGDLNSMDRSLDDQINQVVGSQYAIAQQEMVALKQANHNLLVTLGVATLLSAIFGWLVSMAFARRVTHNIKRVVERANAIATGDLTAGPLHVSSHDEIGTLAAAMQQMQDNLRDILGTVVSTTGTLSASSISMGAASDQIHRRMDIQSQQTQQAAAAMQEMSATVAEVSRHAHNAAETARSAAETAREGGGIVKLMLNSMRSIASAVSETSTTIGLLGEDSSKISRIVSVIEEIAQKTNLLALNAAIEAARAGEQGRGFAVVAGEVRRLAESTAHATGEIATMIQGIQERTRSAVAGMVDGTETVELGMATTNRAGEALERIIGMAERVDRMIAQIAVAASQQAAAADQSSSSLD